MSQAESQAESKADTVDSGFDAFYVAEAEGQVRRAALLLGSDDAANDVVHDALAAIYLRWADIEEPGPYLNRALLNGCRDHVRRRGTQRRLLTRLRPVADSQRPDEPELLDDVLALLPFNQRAAIVLRVYARYTTPEIAEAMGCPSGSIGPWIDRALRTLRRELS